MQDPPTSDEAILPHQETKRIVQQLFSDRASIDAFQDADETTPAALPNNRNDQAIGGDYQNATDATLASQLGGRGSGDTLRDEKREGLIPGEKKGRYSGSSDTVGDENKHSRAQKDTPSEQNSNSFIGDVEKQEGGTTQTPQANRASIDSSRDLEKGETESKEHDKVNKVGEDKARAQWENNVVGWDGPNDPQKPHNWTKSKKYTTTVLYSSMTLCITFASSIFSTATMVTAKMFGVSNEVMTLGTSLFVLVSAHPQHYSHPKLTKTNRASLSVQLCGGMSSPAHVLCASRLGASRQRIRAPVLRSKG